MNTCWMKRFINNLPYNRIFVSRDLLSFGKRWQVDQLTHKLVKEEFIVRLARGVFCKVKLGTEPPTVLEIAEAKARAFGKQIVSHGKNALRSLKIRNEDSSPVQVHFFAVNGRTSAFNTVVGRVEFKSTVPAQVQAGNEKPGLLIRALALLGKKGVTPEDLPKARDNFTTKEFNDIVKKNYAKYMPGWMSDSFVHFSHKSTKKRGLPDKGIDAEFVLWLNDLTVDELKGDYCFGSS